MLMICKSHQYYAIQRYGQLASDRQRLSTVGSCLLKSMGKVRQHLVEHSWFHSNKKFERPDVAFSEMSH